MALATIDETGLHLPDYPTVLEDVKARFRGIYGDDLYLGPDSQDGQLCAVFALALHDAYTLAGSVYNAYSPATAQGTGLSRMVKINGLRRKPSGRSTVDLRLVGQAGTVIRGGMAGDAAGKRWLLPDEVVIPQSGEITVTATAEESGDIRAAAGDIVKILTPAREHHRHVRQDGQFHGGGLSRLVGDPPGNGGLYGNRHRRRIKGLDDAGQRRPHFRLPAVEGRAQGFDGLGPSFSSVHHRASSKGS